MKKNFKPEYIESLRRAWQKRAIQEINDMEKRRSDALLKAVAAATHLKEKYGVKAVYLYGSLARGGHYTNRSDIDFLVEGFSPGMNYWRMLVELEEITNPVEISVVLSDDAAPSLLEKARKEGRLL